MEGCPDGDKIDKKVADMTPVVNDITILMLSVSRWDQDLSSASLSMAKELSKSLKVYYIDHPYSVKDVVLKYASPQVKRRLPALLFGRNRLTRILDKNPNLIAFTPLLTLPINWLPSGVLYNLFSRLNNWIFCYSLRNLIKAENILNYVYWNSYNPFFSFHLPNNVKPSLYIYQSRDNIAESNYVKKHGPRLEQITARQADIRLATSVMLARKLSGMGVHFDFFPNAANVDIFKNAKKENYNRPKELNGISGKVIGYMGNICLRQDYELIYKIAVSNPSHTLLLVGPRNDSSYHTYDFSKIKNVIFTGSKKLEELPQYLAYMDVTILPFLVNELTKGIYPLKLNEYLAAGKPVVSTNFSEDVASFSEYIYLSNNHDEFLKNLSLAIIELNNDIVKQRVAIAKSNSWKVRSAQVLTMIKAHIHH